MSDLHDVCNLCTTFGVFWWTPFSKSASQLVGKLVTMLAKNGVTSDLSAMKVWTCEE